jgi:ribonuclease HII
MLVYAGIDEAGYGPMLGPLCVAATAFVMPDDDPSAGAPDLWRRLNKAVCRNRRDRRRRIAINDSKLLKGASKAKTHPLLHLERGVLSFLGVSEEIPVDERALLKRLTAVAPDQPWYESCSPLPVAEMKDTLRIASARLRRTLETAGVGQVSMRCEIVDADALNEQVERTGSKAAVNLAAALRLADRIHRRWGKAHPRIIVDRHGGRTHYLRELQLAWPEAQITIVAEEPTVSRYRLSDGKRHLTISFVCEAESHHFPVALASMAAKYVRELMMLRLNRYFRRFLPELKPTAGYVQDGRRYLREIESVIGREGIARKRLVRSV